MTQVVEVVVLPRELHLPYACHQFIVRFFRKGKWRILAANEEEKYRLGNEGKKNRKYKKRRSKTPPSLHIRGNEEDTPLGSVIL